MTADRVKKDEYPRIIADYLGILPIEGAGGPWMSRQGTVMKEWLEAVGEAIDVPYQGEKVRTMAALVERVRGRWDSSTMSSKETRSGGGGNITERAFIALLEGLEADVPASMAARARELQHSVSRGQSAHGQGPAHVKSGRPFDATTPDRHDDDRAIRALLIRKGQPRFRAHLLVTYEGRCAVTACGWARSWRPRMSCLIGWVARTPPATASCSALTCTRSSTPDSSPLTTTGGSSFIRGFQTASTSHSLGSRFESPSIRAIVSRRRR